MKTTIWQLLAILVLSVSIGAGGAYAYQMFWPPSPPKLAKAEPKEVCVGRVVYIQFETAVVTKLKPDGKVWTCGGV
jgi:H+/gluconate symporter-like permease